MPSNNNKCPKPIYETDQADFPKSIALILFLRSALFLVSHEYNYSSISFNAPQQAN